MSATFCLSSDLFQGFKVMIMKDRIDSIDGVIGIIRTELMRALDNLNLGALSEKAKCRGLHVHGYTILDVLTSDDDNRIWYVCDHC